MSDARKTAATNNVLLRLQVDIAALQETRLTETGHLEKRQNATERNTTIEERRAALLELKRQPTQSTRQALGEAIEVNCSAQPEDVPPTIGYNSVRAFSWQLARETSGVSTTVSRRPSDQHTARQLHSKAPGLDGIPVEVIQGAKEPLFEHLHALPCQCWVEWEVPQDIRGCTKTKEITVTAIITGGPR